MRSGQGGGELGKAYFKTGLCSEYDSFYINFIQCLQWQPGTHIKSDILI